MANKIGKITVWSVELDDHPGAMAGKLKPLADAGADLQFLLGRRKPESPGRGVLFVAPLQGAKQEAAAKAAGFVPSTDLIGVAVQGANKAGLGMRLSQALAQAGINLRGLSASVIGPEFYALFAFDNPADADKGFKELGKVQ